VEDTVTSNLTGRKIVVSIAVVIVALIATAFAIGGGSDTSESGGGASGSPVAVGAPGHVSGLKAARSNSAGATTSVAPSEGGSFDSAGSAGSGSATAGSSSGNVAADVSSVDAVSGTDISATRVVKTGMMSLEVDKGSVPTVVGALVDLAGSVGGYVASSRTDSFSDSPSGEVILRVPVDKFESAITSVNRLGKQTSLQTSAEDVTGKFVDLAARMHALQRTRQTYLTILGRAHTIGSTLSVQQRVDDVQQQIEELQGKLKVLRNQSNDGTLTVDVAEKGAEVATVPSEHERHGFSLAWHKSIDRFNHGLQAMIGALGPLLLTALILAFAYLVFRVGTRLTARTPRASTPGADIVG
jgi:hypothetical protein